LTFTLSSSVGKGDTGNAGTFIRTVSPSLKCIGQVTLIICVLIKTSKACPGRACGLKVRWMTALKHESPYSINGKFKEMHLNVP